VPSAGFRAGFVLLLLGFVALVALPAASSPARSQDSPGAKPQPQAASSAGSASPTGSPPASDVAPETAPGGTAPEGEGQVRQGPPRKNFLSDDVRATLRTLMVQDFQGRMKPLDTLSREMVVKLTKKLSFEGWQSLDLFLSWMADPGYWFDYPLLAVRNSGVKERLRVPPATTHIRAASLLDRSGKYELSSDVDDILRTPDKDRTKTQRKLLSLDERFNLFLMTLRGRTLRIFPVPGDPNNTWLGFDEVADELGESDRAAYQSAFTQLIHGVQAEDNGMILAGARAVEAIQQKYGAGVLPSRTQLAAEVRLNQLDPFVTAIYPYLVAFLLLMLAYAWSLLRHRGAPYRYRHPFYALGMLVFVAGIVIHLFGYILRWIASGRAPLSNGYESLIFISLMIAVAGFIFETQDRRGSVAGLSAMLTGFILGIAMLPTFDPAISPLVPVLASAWLIIHVTVITASYGFLGLASFMAMTMLILYLFKKPGRQTIQIAIFEMNQLLWNVLLTGLAFLSVGTLLGGVWANESWGRYWGWDPKETWSLVTILVYAAVVHFRYIPSLARPWFMAAGSFLAIISVVMTYFGVNYFLSGLHSYAEGEAPAVPIWAYITVAIMVGLVFLSYLADSSREWERPRRRPA
jgi:cytochrome c-type biogenesis protein CcsB